MYSNTDSWGDYDVKPASKIISAKEAREIATDVTKGKNKKQLDEVMELINGAAINGNDSIHLYEKLYAPVENKLKNLGYTVSSYHDQRDGYSISISW